MILLAKIRWFDEYGDLIEDDLIDSIEWSVDGALELKDNKCTVNLRNPWSSTDNHKYVDKDGNIRFKEGQILKIYAKHSTSASQELDLSTTSTDLLMTVDITEFNPVHSENRETIKIVGVDRSYVALNKIWSEVYPSSDNKTAPQIIREILRNTTQSEFGSGGYSLNVSLTTDSPPGFVNLTSCPGVYLSPRTSTLPFQRACETP